MEITVKDGVFFAVYLVTIVSLWNGFRNDIKNNALGVKTNTQSIKELSTLFRNVIFSESGDSLLTTKKDCEKINLELKRQADSDRLSTSTISEKIVKMDKNIIRIMCHLKIDESIVLYQRIKGKEDHKS